MVCINDNGRVFELFFCRIHIVKSDKILIVLIGVADAVLIHAASENCVSKLIAA